MSPLSREDLYPHHVYVSNITPEGKGVWYSHTAFDGSHMFLPVMFDWRNKKQQQDHNWHPNQASDRNILESAKAPGTISPWPYDYVQWTYFGDSEDPSQDIHFYNARHDFKNPDTLRVQVVRNPFERMLSVYLHVCKYLETPTYGAIQHELPPKIRASK